MRYDFLRNTGSLQSATDNVPIERYDILNVRWQDFPFQNGYQNHTITKQETMRPWLISFKYYNSAFYEDVLFLINGVRDPLNLVVGQNLKVPPVSEIEAFVNAIQQ